MTNVDKFSTVLRNSASSPASSTKLSSSSASAPRRLNAFKLQELRSTRRCRSLSPRPSFSRCRGDLTLCEAQDASFEDHEHVVAERNILRDQLARRKEEIKKLEAVVDSAFKDLNRVINYLKESPDFHEEEPKITELPLSEPAGVKSTEMGEVQNVQPITPEVKMTGKRRNDVWGRSNGDDPLPPQKKSHLDRSKGRSFP